METGLMIKPEELILFAFIYLFCFLGAFSKDMLDTFLDKIPRVLITKVLISSLGGTILLFGASEKILEKLTYRSFTTLCYGMGLVSFEVLVRYSNGKELVGILRFIQQIQYHKSKDQDKE